MNPQQRHRLLLQGLVGDEHAQQFATDVSFNHSIEMLARMLPSMIDGFAVASSAAEAQRADAMDRLRRGLGIPDELAGLFAGGRGFEALREADERLGAHLEAEARRLCSCPDPLSAADPHCQIHGFMTDIGLGGRRQPAEPGVDVSDSTIADTSWRDGAR